MNKLYGEGGGEGGGEKGEGEGEGEGEGQGEGEGEGERGREGEQEGKGEGEGGGREMVERWKINGKKESERVTENGQTDSEVEKKKEMERKQKGAYYQSEPTHQHVEDESTGNHGYNGHRDKTNERLNHEIVCPTSAVRVFEHVDL